MALFGIGFATLSVSPAAGAAPCKDKHARIIKRVTTAGKVIGKLKHLRKKDGKVFAFNTTHYAYHRSKLTLRWPAGMRAKNVGSIIIDVVAKPLARQETWWFEIRDFRRRKWVKMGTLSWRDGGSDKSYRLRTVDVGYYRHKRGYLMMAVRSAHVGDLYVDRLRLRLGCK